MRKFRFESTLHFVTVLWSDRKDIAKAKECVTEFSYTNLFFIK